MSFATDRLALIANCSSGHRRSRERKGRRVVYCRVVSLSNGALITIEARRVSRWLMANEGLEDRRRSGRMAKRRHGPPRSISAITRTRRRYLSLVAAPARGRLSSPRERIGVKKRVPGGAGWGRRGLAGAGGGRGRGEKERRRAGWAAQRLRLASRTFINLDRISRDSGELFRKPSPTSRSHQVP